MGGVHVMVFAYQPDNYSYLVSGQNFKTVNYLLTIFNSPSGYVVLIQPISGNRSFYATTQNLGVCKSDYEVRLENHVVFKAHEKVRTYLVAQKI